MQNIFIQYIFLILIIMGLVMIANRLKVAYPIVLVVGGLLLSFTTPFSHIEISPEMVFFIFLPPLLYEAAWQVSWKEFWRFRRVITSLAFPIVIINSCVIAFFSAALIPQFTLALGFLLGGIISPPDAISATTIMRRVKVPRTIMTIIEGESLLNDASSLIVFRFALIAVTTGTFHFGAATANFFLVIVMGVAIGLAVGLVFYAIHRWLPTTSSIEIILTLVTPYCMYYAAEQFHFSGVLAVVSGGLLLSSKRQAMLNYRSRIEAVNVWSNLVFVMNGLVFSLIGLQLPTITSQLGNVSVYTAIGYGLLISLVLIVARMLCAFGAAIFTLIAARFITVAESRPGWKGPTIIGWAGMRGVVSLAAALSIPVMLQDGKDFPHRNLILFITFVVILVTLVLQGFTLPWLIKKLDLKEREDSIPDDKQEMIIQKKMAMYAMKFLDERRNGDRFDNEHLNNLYTRMKLDLDHFTGIVNHSANTNGSSLKEYEELYLEVLDYQRSLLRNMNKHAEFDEDIIRKYSTLIDLEEFKIRERLSE